MSTGLNLEYIEVQPGAWFYILEDDGAPKNAFDWREFSTAYGPFQSLDAAWDHRVANHANPGGAVTLPYVEGREPDATVQALVRVARAPEVEESGDEWDEVALGGEPVGMSLRAYREYHYGLR